MDALGVLNKLAQGRLIESLHAAIVEVAEAVIATEKAGSVTLTLKIAKVGDYEAVTVAEQIKRGLPVPKERGALFFVGDGELHKEDPRQIPMEFRVVQDADSGVRTLEDEPKETRQAK